MRKLGLGFTNKQLTKPTLFKLKKTGLRPVSRNVQDLIMKWGL